MTTTYYSYLDFGVVCHKYFDVKGRIDNPAVSKSSKIMAIPNWILARFPSTDLVNFPQICGGLGEDPKPSDYGSTTGLPGDRQNPAVHFGCGWSR
jgi:hypothetical protein